MTVLDGLPDGEATITSTVVRYESDEDECTLHPENPPAETRTTAWITAKRGAYVSVVARR